MLPNQRPLLFGSQGWRRYAAEWGLVSHYKLDEASGNALDAYGSNNLTATAGAGSIGAAVGKIDGARLYTSADNQYHTLADNAAFSVADVDWWISCWLYWNTQTTLQHIAGKVTNYSAYSTCEYGLHSGSADATQLRLAVSDAAGTGGQNVVTAAGLGTGVWHFVMGYHDAAADLIGISVNGAAFVTGALAGGCRDGTAPFGIGGDTENSQDFDGRIDAVSFGKGGGTALWNTIRNTLYNGGAGRAF